VDKCDCIVIGAGIVGLSVARRLALAGRDVVILEAESTIGSGISSRNSGVIHAGIYYPSESLKARLCVEGKKRLYKYCVDRNITHSKIGKVLIAPDESEIPTLQDYYELGHQNNVKDLQWLDPQETKTLEPNIRCAAAIWSPSTGIIDVHDYMLALLGDAETNGAMLALKSPMTRAWLLDDSAVVEVGGDDPIRVKANLLINCAGLGAEKVARQIDGLPSKHIPTIFFAKGNYFFLKQKAPFQHLIYPLPSRGGLGVHSSYDLAGRCRFGPDIHWIDRPDYAVDEHNLDDFYKAIRRYWPSLPDNSLAPDYTGIRPKLTRPGESSADFVIQTQAQHGIKCLINLFGIESPGLTASLAIAELVHKHALILNS